MTAMLEQDAFDQMVRRLLVESVPTRPTPPQDPRSVDSPAAIQQRCHDLLEEAENFTLRAAPDLDPPDVIRARCELLDSEVEAFERRPFTQTPAAADAASPVGAAAAGLSSAGALAEGVAPQPIRPAGGAA